MASPVYAVLCAMVAAAFCTLLGYAVGRSQLPRGLAIGAAPVMGWAVHSALALPVFILAGFSSVTVIAFAALCMLAAVALLLVPAWAADDKGAAIPAWTYGAAGLLALVPAVALLPKV